MDSGSGQWLQALQAIQAVVTTLGIVAAAAWALYRFGARREGESALAIDLELTVRPYRDDRSLVFFDVELANTGAVRLAAKRRKDPAFSDLIRDGEIWGEEIRFSGDLMLSRVPDALAHGHAWRWYRQPRSDAAVDILEFDLLEEYDDGDGRSAFWMEPGEVYRLGVPIVLRAGIYVAKVTFIGQRSDQEFWRRLFLVQVPRADPGAASLAPAGRPA